MNFITYINLLGKLKTAEISFDSATQQIETLSTINEGYIVTSIFVDGEKRKLLTSSPVQIAVINDNNFDGSLLGENDFYTEGTKFSATLLPLPVVGGGATTGGAPSYNYLPKTLFNPSYNNQSLINSDDVVYSDLFINDLGDNSFKVVHYKFWDNELLKSVPLVTERLRYGFNSTCPIGCVYIKSGKLGYSSMTVTEFFVARVYVNMRKKTYHISVCFGTVFNPQTAIEADYNLYGQLQTTQSLAVLGSVFTAIFQISDY